MRLNLKLSEAWEWTVGVGLTLLLASLSHFFVEQKALRLRHRFGWREGGGNPQRALR
jgi:peptidoglycan/LPS O-acetylase OafA/YrhL